MGLTWQQLGYWKDSETLFRHALEVTENNYLAHNNLGAALYKKGQTDEAIPQFQEVLRLQPDDAETHNNLGAALVRKGQTDEAIRQFQEALRLQPDSSQLHLALARILPQLGRLKDAAFHLEAFLRACPRVILEAPNSPIRESAVGALNDLAWFLATRPQAEERDGARAVGFAERACEMTQYRQAIVVDTLAAAYAEAGRFPEAVTTAERATALATQAGDQVLLAKNQQFLELYRARRPYHEPTGPVQSQPAP
jgi:tetratricopeptide (TPR) repeat protein